jgi:hypothetical protein
MAHNSNLRQTDHPVERAVGEYLDSHLYCNSPFDSFERITDDRLQRNGVDVIVSSALLNISGGRIDEKCTAHYVNQDIPTFAFEIGSFQDDIWREGWLYNEDSLTDYYLLLWPKAELKDSEKDKKAPRFNCDEITSITYYLVSRNAIIQYLEEHEMNKARVLRAEKYFRDNNIVNGSDEHKKLKEKTKKKGRFYFVLTDSKDNNGLAERPFNVLLYRDVLKNLAIYMGVC